MISGFLPSRRAFSFDRPAFQWDAHRGGGPLIVRLYGRLGAREVDQIAGAIAERGRAPNDLVCVDFEQVTHVDYRALPDFARALTRQMNRGASVLFLGLSAYVRDLFAVAGQGPALARLEWTPVKEAAAPRRPILGFASRAWELPARSRDIGR